MMGHKNINKPWIATSFLNNVITKAASIFVSTASCWSSKPYPLELVEPVRSRQVHHRWQSCSNIAVTNGKGLNGEIIFDYGRCEGGLPVFEISEARSSSRSLEFDVVYSESWEGLENEQGDGPYFLFSNAMNTYRRETYRVEINKIPITLKARYTQQSQRYQRVILKTSNSSIRFSRIGFQPVRRSTLPSCTFSCSDDILNKIYKDGVRTVELCTLNQREVPEAWEVTEVGTRVFGQHWAPCRQGTRWGDVLVDFEVLVEHVGASWGIHMVSNGLIFCLDVTERAVHLFEGLSHVHSVFPTIDRGSWTLSDDIDETDWLAVQIIATGSTVVLKINGHFIGKVDELNIRPLLGGSGNNTGSIAFGGPAEYVSIYRNLKVSDEKGFILYNNDLLFPNKHRTLADFAVGSNQYACTIDGAKRDRAIFAGDLYVMARSIYYSTGRIEAVLGSLQLLISHQTTEGYTGNLCPVQAPLHDGTDQPPTYAFYSLSYALLLIPTIKEYWLYTGDEDFVRCVWQRLDKLVKFAQGFVNESGLIEAPPPLSMDWFPLGGPIFGASSKINIAYYDALICLAGMSTALNLPNHYTTPAAILKDAILKDLYDTDCKSMKVSTVLPLGRGQDIDGYAITAGIMSGDTFLAKSESNELPLAFKNIHHLEKIKVVSPYTAGFATEAAFINGNAQNAVGLIKRIWGIMANTKSVNYSGAHWEAMKPDGTPFAHDTSLAHGWSTWPTFLLPKYLGGVMPLEAGWKRWCVKPTLAGLSTIDVALETVNGAVRLSLRVSEADRKGKMVIMIPRGTICEISSPKGWAFELDSKRSVALEMLTEEGRDEEVVIRIFKR